MSGWQRGSWHARHCRSGGHDAIHLSAMAGYDSEQDETAKDKRQIRAGTTTEGTKRRFSIVAEVESGPGSVVADQAGCLPGAIDVQATDMKSPG